MFIRLIIFQTLFAALMNVYGASEVIRVKAGSTVSFPFLSDNVSPISWTRQINNKTAVSEQYIWRCPENMENFKCNIWTDWTTDFKRPISVIHPNGTLTLFNVTKQDEGEYFPTYGRKKVIRGPHGVWFRPANLYLLLVIANNDRVKQHWTQQFLFTDDSEIRRKGIRPRHVRFSGISF
ncbi:hypothetical protein Tcan_13436 [Toxocara canis]|uniref:Uncharacterized protein n=1 Tax=Toxocara canis TaxID=6265 RepID=A0A0B2W0X4_TOXCA|nr:hypothetical protein Tcan_13436 [Toxocara canis]